MGQLVGFGKLGTEFLFVLFGGVMKGSRQQDTNERIRVELKYCEHCGGLWLRECGAGVVYCPNCQPKVADLPVPRKKRPQRVMLPVRRRTLVEQYEADNRAPDESDLEAAGGVA